jgi:Protein of unknown function (DUF1064)
MPRGSLPNSLGAFMKTSERKAWAERIDMENRGREIMADFRNAERKAWANRFVSPGLVAADLKALPAVKPPYFGPKSKYRAKITEVDGIKFASKLEADRYKQLKLLKASGEVCYFLRQVPFDLPGGAVYRCDFMVIYPFGPLSWAQHTEFEDCKGYMTPLSKLKIKQVEALYPVKIKILTRKDIGK